MLSIAERSFIISTAFYKLDPLPPPLYPSPLPSSTPPPKEILISLLQDVVEIIVDKGPRVNIEVLIRSQRESKVFLRKQQEEERIEASPMASEEIKTLTLAATSGIEAENATEITSKLSQYYMYVLNIWLFSLVQSR